MLFSASFFQFIYSNVSNIFFNIFINIKVKINIIKNYILLNSIHFATTACRFFVELI